MIQKGRVPHVAVFLYGKQLIENLEVGDSTSGKHVEIPTNFKFNSSWKIEHSCLSCGNSVSVDQNFEESESNFSVLKNIDSFNYARTFLNEISALFDSIELVNLDEVVYLNRTDFNYDFDFQRKSSIDLTHYSCDSCQNDYLGLIRIGFPLPPERGLETGRVGQVEVADLVMIETSNGFNEYCSMLRRNED